MLRCSAQIHKIISIILDSLSRHTHEEIPREIRMLALHTRKKRTKQQLIWYTLS